MSKDPNINHWLLTAWENEETGSNAIEEVNDSFDATTTMPTRTRHSGDEPVSTNSIRNPTKIVKENSTVPTETEQFKRWFGKSKAVNKDGTPRILYHRTNSVFTEFDTTKSGENQGKTHGDGIYLSSNKTGAQCTPLRIYQYKIRRR